MSYIVTSEIYEMTLDFLALLNCNIRQMEWDNKTSDISYKCMKDRLKGEVNMFAFLFDVEVSEVYKTVTRRAKEIERAYIPIRKYSSAKA